MCNPDSSRFARQPFSLEPFPVGVQRPLFCLIPADDRCRFYLHELHRFKILIVDGGLCCE
jgi:hypothetical protein